MLLLCVLLLAVVMDVVVGETVRALAATVVGSGHVIVLVCGPMTIRVRLRLL